MSTDGNGLLPTELLAEAEELMDRLSLDLVSLSDCVDRRSADPELVNSIFRGAHSLKGLAGMCGLVQIAELAHALEHLLDALRLGKTPLVPQTIQVLFEVLELLGNLVRAAGGDDGVAYDSAAILGRIEACLYTPPEAPVQDTLSAVRIPEQILRALTEYEEHRLRENLAAGNSLILVRAAFSLQSFDSDLLALTEQLKQFGEVISTLPSPGASLDAGIEFILLYGSAGAAQVSALLAERDGVTLTILDKIAGPEPSPPPVAEGGGDERQQTARSVSRTVRVDIARLDEMMNIVGDLVLCHGAIAGIAGELQGGTSPALALALGKASRSLERKLAELRTGVMAIRMVPLAQLFDRMGRIARKISVEQGKRVELRICGGDTELDKLLVEEIADPLMHLIRNAVDHGVETPEERRAVAKSELAVIKLSSQQQGNHVLIQVEDDGRGVDLDRVRDKALAMGLIQHPPSDAETLELVFHPGLSTSAALSEVSGRGVGMDVVRRNITALSGTVRMESRRGEGSRVTITLPSTLAMIRCLTVSCAGRVYAVPVTAIQESLLLAAGDLRSVERDQVLLLRDEALPLLRMDQLFQLRKERSGGGDEYVVVLSSAGRRLGLVVDDLLGQQDLVVKPLGDLFSGVAGFSGAADLGERGTILVLDGPGIIAETFRG